MQKKVTVIKKISLSYWMTLTNLAIIFYWEWAECDSTQPRLRIIRQFLKFFFDSALLQRHFTILLHSHHPQTTKQCGLRVLWQAKAHPGHGWSSWGAKRSEAPRILTQAQVSFSLEISKSIFEGKFRARQRTEFDRDFWNRWRPEGAPSYQKLVLEGRGWRPWAPQN